MRLKGLGQQFADSRGLEQLAVSIRDQDQRIQAELRQHLAARAARRAAVIGHDRDHLEFMLALGDRLEDGHTFGADTGWVGGILDVDTGIDAAGLRAQRRADRIVGIRRVGTAARFVRQIDQGLTFLIVR